MNTLSPIVDFDDAAHNPFEIEDQAYGDREDLYTPLSALMAKSPVHQGEFLALMGSPADSNFSDAPIYTVFGYREVLAVVNDPETFSIDAYKANLGRTFGNTLSLINQPEHSGIRKVFQKAFLPHIVTKWGDDLVSPTVNGLIDKFIDRGEADLAKQFALKYPFEIIYKQLALPERDISTFHKLAASMTQCYGDLIRHGMEASRKLGAYFNEMIAERRRNPADDLVSLLVHAEVDGERIPDDVIISFFRQLISAAGDTTYRGTGALLIALLRNPDHLEQVRQDRGLVPQAIEEALRWDGPVTVYFRAATRDTELAGVRIPKGATINVAVWAANHDITVFSDPMKFDIHRKRERHVAFGWGNHMCLGQHLARLEMTRALNAILDRLKHLRLDLNKTQPRIVGDYSRTPRDINVLFER
jgi:cytochrome P450